MKMFANLKSATFLKLSKLPLLSPSNLWKVFRSEVAAPKFWRHFQLSTFPFLVRDLGKVRWTRTAPIRPSWAYLQPNSGHKLTSRDFPWVCWPHSWVALAQVPSSFSARWRSRPALELASRCSEVQPPSFQIWSGIEFIKLFPPKLISL